MPRSTALHMSYTVSAATLALMAEAYLGEVDRRSPTASPLFADLAGLPPLLVQASLAIAGAGRRVSVDLLEGYAFAQVYAPAGQDYVALEPMTAPTNALVSGRSLQFVAPGARYTATFRIRVDALV